MDLDELRAFLAVVETGSLVAAARSVRFARATLRRRLDELEARVGIPLLTRSGDGLVPTPAGELLAKRARTILQDVGALISAVRSVPSEDRDPSGLLRVVVAAGLPPAVVMMTTSMLAEQFPRLKAEMRITEDPLTELDEADLAFYFGEADPAGAWRSHGLFSTRLQLLGTSTYLARHGRPLSLADLSGHRIAAWRSPGSSSDLLPLVDGTSVSFEPYFTSTDAHQLHLLAQQDGALVLTPHVGPIPGAFDELGEAVTLLPVLPELVGRDVCIRIGVPAALAQTPRMSAVLSYLRLILGGKPAG
jgi:DNA-binding transcriptional LysR family regulator